MTELSAILGFAGAILILAGLLGGGFSFMSSSIPTVGKAIRFPCFLMGGVLITVAVGLAVSQNRYPGPDNVSVSRTAPSSSLPNATTVTSASATDAEARPSDRSSTVLSASTGLLATTSIESPATASASPAVVSVAVSDPAPTTPTSVVEIPVTPGTGIVQGETISVAVYDRPSLFGIVLYFPPNGVVLQILCTTQGDLVTRSDSGISSRLWNFVSDGSGIAYIPDVYLYTGTDEPTMPDCGV